MLLLAIAVVTPRFATAPVTAASTAATAWGAAKFKVLTHANNHTHAPQGFCLWGVSVLEVPPKVN
jgi:hypothetical protein